MKKLLFISHQASLTGAPLVLVNFLRWVKQNYPDKEVHVLFLTDGDRIDEFKKVSDKIFHVKKSYLQQLTKRFFNKIGIKQKEFSNSLTNKLIKEKYDYIHCNTVLTLEIGLVIKADSNAKLLLHVHELQAVILQSCPNLQSLSTNIDYYVAVSEAVKQNLISSFNVPDENITVVHAFIEKPECLSFEKHDNNSFIIGASGEVHWRKGHDIFLQVAAIFKKMLPHANILFQWVGHLNEFEKTIVDEDIRKLGIKDIVWFSGQTKTPLNLYANFDIFLMPSREDPFPLVSIENAVLGKPIICFENAGGTAEIIAEGGGIVVPYLDTKSMAEAVAVYYKDFAKRKKDGNFLKEYASQYFTDQLAPQLYNCINNLF